MSDKEQERFRLHLSAYALPITFLVIGFLAQQQYNALREQLTRIETQQTSHLVEITQLKARVTSLQDQLQQRKLVAPQEPAQRPESRPAHPAYVYSQG